VHWWEWSLFTLVVHLVAAPAVVAAVYPYSPHFAHTPALRFSARLAEGIPSVRLALT
jgi:hypothetical protein